MKYLMVIAAAASLAAVAEAGIFVNTNCHPRALTCPVVAFKVTGSGKIAAPVEKKDDIYKTASKLQIRRGALVLFGSNQASGVDKDGNLYTVDIGEVCCYENYSLYLQVRVNKETYPVGIFFQPIDSWSIFGKGYTKALDADKSKKYKLESELGLSYAVAGNSLSGLNSSGSLGNGGDTITSAGDPGLTDNMGLNDFAFIASAFGKGTWKYTSEKTSACNVCTVTSEYEFTPGIYSGWFAGFISDLGGDFDCFLCSCADLDVFGGTWKAKFDKSWSKTAEGWQKAASYVFGASTVAEMKAINGTPADPSSWLE